MYSHQNGFVPFVTKMIGMVILVYSIATTLFETISKLITNNTPIDFFITLVAFIVVILIPLWIGLLLVKMFPAIRLAKAGIKYSSLGLLTGIIKWDEIEEVLLFENGYVAIAFQRPGVFIVNGTYFNKLYGVLIHYGSPVLFLAPNIANREEILKAIYQNSKVNSHKRVGYRR